MSIDVMKCIKNPFKNKFWWVYSLMISILCYTPMAIIFLSIYFKHFTTVTTVRLSFPFLMLLLFIPQGFIMRFVHKELNNEGYENLNLMQDLSGSFKMGLKALLISFLYAVLMLIIFSAFVGYYMMDDYFTAIDLLSPSFFFQSEVMTVILVFIGIFLIFFLILVPYFLIAYSENLILSEAFNWRKVFAKLYKSWKDLLISILGIILINIFVILTACVFIWITQTWTNALFSAADTATLNIYNIPLVKVLIILIFAPATIIVPIVIVSFIGTMIGYQMMSQVYKSST